MSEDNRETSNEATEAEPATASDPVPVNPVQIDPAALMQGFFVGQAIRRMRGKPVAHTHAYTPAVTAPTCTEKGFTTYTCACGDSYTAEETEALGHAYVSEVIAPTTETEGYTLHTCSRCGDSYKDNYTEKLPSLPEKGNDLADYSWAEISEISKAGAAPEYFAVGDEKDITLTTGEAITLRIIGFNHDILSDGSGYSGITFQMENCLPAVYRMHSSNTNSVGWIGSAMRTRLQPGGAIFETLPGDVKTVICPVDKVTSEGNKSTNLITTSDYLFLLSEMEVFGYQSYAVVEGSQYVFYEGDEDTTAQKAVKYCSGNLTTWWERSPRATTINGYAAVNAVGKPTAGYASNSNTEYSVSFAFCV